jgi:hypothetical protein
MSTRQVHKGHDRDFKPKLPQMSKRISDLWLIYSVIPIKMRGDGWMVCLLVV